MLEWLSKLINDRHGMYDISKYSIKYQSIFPNHQLTISDLMSYLKLFNLIFIFLHNPDEIIKYLLISQVGLAVVAISLGVIFSWASTYDEPQPQKNPTKEAGPVSPASAVSSPVRSIQSTPQAQSGKQNNSSPSSGPNSSPSSCPNPSSSPNSSQTPAQASGSTAVTPLASSPRSVNTGEAAQKTPAQPVAREVAPAGKPPH
jgi:hypothetical protein